MKSCLILLPLFISLVQAQIYNVTSTWSFNQAQLDSFIAALNRTTEDQWFYHWGSFEDGIRWARQGVIDQQEMNVLNAGYGSGGGGFYLSTGKSDSSSYGTWPSIVLMPKGTLIFESGDVKKTAALLLLLGKTTPLDKNKEKPKLGTIVPFWDKQYWDFTNSWSVCHSAQVIKKIMPAFEAPAPLNVSMDEGSKHEMSYNGAYWILQQIEGKAEYKKWSNTTEIKQLMHAIRFLGPVETLCRLKSSDPSSFFQQIDTPRFHAFLNFFEWASSYNSTNPLNIGYSRVWGYPTDKSNLTRPEWARKQVEELIPKIQDILRGNASGEVVWRGEEKCKGGEGGVQVDDTELKTLMSNAYITVEILRRNETTRRSWVKWCYPSVLHYNSSHVSNETHALIQSYPREKIEQNIALRTKLNKMLLKDMTTQFLLQLYGTELDNYQSPISVFESFMPAEDMSGIRWWSWLGLHELYFWTDEEQDIEMKGMELLLRDYKLTSAIIGYRQKLYSMEMALVNQLVLSIYHNTTAPSQATYVQMLKEYHYEFTNQFTPRLQYTAEQCDMMLAERWTELFDSIGSAR